MNHRAFLASLSPEDRTALTERSDWPGLAHLALHLSFIIALGWMIALGAPGWPLLLVPQGVALVFLFTLLHETTHDTPFRSRWLNRAAGWLAGLTVGLPPLWFRYFHLAHHRHTHDPARDPELAQAKPETALDYAIHVSGVPAWRSHLSAILRNARGGCDDDYVPDGRRGDVRREARVMLAVYAALIGLSLWALGPLLLWVWILPLALGQPFLRLYLLAEHARCPHVSDMFQNTRTTFTTALVRRLAWNMPYHAEHHAMPQVPFHKLPALHAKAQAHLGQTVEGYGAFNRDYARSLS